MRRIKTKYRRDENLLLNEDLELHREIFEKTSFLNEDVSFEERLYNWLNEKTSYDVCPICNSNVTRMRSKIINGYKKCCSNECECISRVKESEKTCLSKYGVKNPSQVNEVQTKIKKTNLERHGSEYYVTSEQFKNDILEIYGVENPFQSEEIKEKIRETWRRKYRVTHPQKSEKIKNKTKQTNLKRYNVASVFQLESIKEKIKETNLKKYGVEYSTQSTITKEKIKQTNFKKYGVENVYASEYGKQKIKETNLKKYGVQYATQHHEIKEKTQKTNKNNRYEILKKKLKFKQILLLSDKQSYINNKIYNFFCNKCNKHFQSSSTNFQDVVCPNCITIRSKFEDEIIDFLSTHNIQTIKNSRSIIPPLELDIFLPDYNLAIEFHGLYWHSEPHKNKNYHLNKLKRCQEKNIKLIQIFENEWVHKQEIVKSIILSKLGIFEEKIFASDCEVKEISMNEAGLFCEENHLNGYIESEIHLGLYFNDLLVSVMTLKSSNNKMELARYCTKLNTCVVESFSKLINSYKNSFITFCDLRYFTGETYFHHGFQLIQQIPPNSYYWKSPNLWLDSEQNNLKNFLENFDETKTLHENMLNNKYLRIYDCGSLKLKYVAGDK